MLYVMRDKCSKRKDSTVGTEAAAAERMVVDNARRNFATLFVGKNVCCCCCCCIRGTSGEDDPI